MELVLLRAVLRTTVVTPLNIRRAARQFSAKSRGGRALTWLDHGGLTTQRGSITATPTPAVPSTAQNKKHSRYVNVVNVVGDFVQTEGSPVPRNLVQHT